VIYTQPRTAEMASAIPPEDDPRLVDGAGKQQQRLARLSPAQRAALVVERYPELRALPNCDWQRVSVRASFSILYGESSRHFARLELAVLAGVLASAGITLSYATEVDGCVRSILDLLQQRFGITTPRAITLDVWEAWGRDTDRMRTLTVRLRKYAAAVNHHLGEFPRATEPRGPRAHRPSAAAAAAKAVPPPLRAGGGTPRRCSTPT
jgi:hypothetical protein